MVFRTHRRRLMGYVQEIYEAEGTQRAFADEWKAGLRNDLLDPDTDETGIIAQIRQARLQRDG